MGHGLAEVVEQQVKGKPNSCGAGRLASRRCAGRVFHDLGGWVPYLDGQLTAPVHLYQRLGRLVDDEALDRHGVLGQLDERDPEVQPAHHPHEHVVEQPPDVRYGDPPLILMVGMLGQPEVQRP